MLSLVDLIEAGTLDLALAAYLAAAMRSGASLLVGARPGGAGKTAVMCALLNFLPNQTSIRAVDSWSALDDAGQSGRGQTRSYIVTGSSSHNRRYAPGRQPEQDSRQIKAEFDPD